MGAVDQYDWQKWCGPLPNEEKMAILYSYSNKPTELFIQDNPIKTNGNTQAEQITKSNSDDFNGYDWKDKKSLRSRHPMVRKFMQDFINPNLP